MSDRVSVKDLRRAMDHVGLHQHSMSDPTKEQRLIQRGGSEMRQAVEKLCRTEPPVEAGEVARVVRNWLDERGEYEYVAHLDADTKSLLRAIDQARTGQAGKGWVSVEERLPELEETVMVCMADKSVFSSWLEELPEEHSAEDWPPDGVSFPPAWAANEFGEVTHWQPLPAPPEEGS